MQRVATLRGAAASCAVRPQQPTPSRVTATSASTTAATAAALPLPRTSATPTSSERLFHTGSSAEKMRPLSSGMYSTAEIWRADGRTGARASMLRRTQSSACVDDRPAQLSTPSPSTAGKHAALPGRHRHTPSASRRHGPSSPPGAATWCTGSPASGSAPATAASPPSRRGAGAACGSPA